MKNSVRHLIKKICKPARTLLGRFVYPPYASLKKTMPIYVASEFVCSEQIPGDYLEFGVFRGASFTMAHDALTESLADWNSRKRANLAFSNPDRAKEAFQRVEKNLHLWAEKRFFAFDSFAGLPPTDGIDEGSARFTQGRYDCSQKEFIRILHRGGVDLGKVVIVPGFYDQSLTEEVKRSHQLTAASIVHIDCDLYSSTCAVLNFITNLLVEGSVLIFDDWFNFKASPELGEQRACREWLERNPHFRLIPYVRWGVTQQSFIVHIPKNR